MSEYLADVLGSNGETIHQDEIMNGVVPAIVSNTQDEEKLGRIKVNFPWLADNSETDWVRVMSPFAGSSRGFFFLPEVGDEVLVAFQKGNINAPYVIGSLWSNIAKPPDENNYIKIIKTNCGHTITLDDTSGSEKIEIVDKAGTNKISIDSVANSIDIEGMIINITATGVLTLKGASVAIIPPPPG
jgi:uncharacterized protein involved in type VI secretion and phage assembly